MHSAIQNHFFSHGVLRGSFTRSFLNFTKTHFMLQVIKGYYDHGTIVLEEQPCTKEKIAVLVTFVGEDIISNTQKKGGVIIGGFEGLVTIPNNFDEPKEDIKEYV